MSPLFVGHSISKNKISRISKIWPLSMIFKSSKYLIFNNCHIICKETWGEHRRWLPCICYKHPYINFVVCFVNVIRRRVKRHIYAYAEWRVERSREIYTRTRTSICMNKHRGRGGGPAAINLLIKHRPMVYTL